MYYINYDKESGTIIGIYPSSFNFDKVPDPKIAITDAQYNALDDGEYIVQNGMLVKQAKRKSVYYVNYDEDTREVLSIYPSNDIDYDDVPDPKITITEAEYNEIGEGEYIVQNGVLVKQAERKSVYYVNYNEDTREVLGIYPSDVDYDDVPDPKITITEAEYNEIGEGEYIVQNGVVVNKKQSANVYYINYDKGSGTIISIFPPDCDPDDVPDPKIAITEEQYNAIDDSYIVKDGVLVSVDETEDPSIPYDGDNREELQPEYEEYMSKLKEAYLSAEILDNTSLATSIKGGYYAAMANFIDGKAFTSDDEEYCPLCGTLIKDGVCPNCHWRS